ncbi:MAG: beta-N-acetylhexosaminidase [Terracidiphilus sp.]|nr:beta-N-acetylhexosaminidase [Terracidiphilus sp.]
MTMNLRHAAGSLLVVGLAGTELTGLERAWLKLVRPSGIILFRRNISDPAQARALLAQATAFCNPNSIRCVDVEGGTVDRLRDALAPMPSVQAVALAAENTGKLSLIHQHGELIARAVKAFGFNTSLAPVVDLALPISAKVMGSRVAAPTAAGTVLYARNFLAGLAAHGVAGCGKHFPGLGGGTLDSHLDTPTIARSAREIWNTDLVPYRELHAQMPIVMINHAAYPDTPGKGVPASASKYWITSVLRKRIGYRGIVLSDDLEMGGILKFLPIDEAAVQTIRAGSDLSAICHSPELTLRAYEALITEGERSAAFRKLLLARAAQSAHQLKKLYAGRATPALTPKQFDALRTRVLRFGQTIAAVQPPSWTPQS